MDIYYFDGGMLKFVELKEENKSAIKLLNTISKHISPLNSLYHSNKVHIDIYRTKLYRFDYKML